MTPAKAIAAWLESQECGKRCPQPDGSLITDPQAWPLFCDAVREKGITSKCFASPKAYDGRHIGIYATGGFSTGAVNCPTKCDEVNLRILVRACDYDAGYAKVCEIRRKLCSVPSIAVENPKEGGFTSVTVNNLTPPSPFQGLDDQYFSWQFNGVVTYSA